METAKGKIVRLEEDLKNRVLEECKSIKKAANPRREVRMYVKNIRWGSPELAAFLEKEMSAIFNSDD